MSINFVEADSIFAPYFSPEKGRVYELVLANWRIDERKKFDQQDEGEEKEKVLAFDVLKIDGEEFPIGTYVWRSGSSRLYKEIRTILSKAQANGLRAVLVNVELTRDNHYKVTDLTKFMGEKNGQ